MTARIFRTPMNAMQSGQALAGKWVLEFEPSEARKADPLTGWAGSGDTQKQVVLQFSDLSAAQAYADKNGIDYSVVTPPNKTLKIQTYADNFH